MKKIVLAFSGGLDTSWCVPWLKENHQASVTTVYVDVAGLDDEAANFMATQSKALGADEHLRVDATEAFYGEILRFLIMGNVMKGNLYPLCVGAERTIQAREAAKIAQQIGAESVTHGCTAAGNDQVRFEVALRTLAPELGIIAPIRDLTPSRQEEVDFLKERNLPVPGFGAAYSVNEGLWGVTIGGKETTDTKASLPETAWYWTKGAFEFPRAPETLDIAFEKGEPISINGEKMNPVSIIRELNELGGSFGIGRGIHLGDTILGMKGRVAFEAPAASILIAAHRELEKLTLTGRQIQAKETLAALYGQYVHEGLWLEPVCRDIEAFFLSSQQRVSGVVHLLLRPGSAFVEGVESPYSLRAASKSVYGEAIGEWSAADAQGFSRLFGLSQMLHHRAGQTAEGDE